MVDPAGGTGGSRVLDQVPRAVVLLRSPILVKLAALVWIGLAVAAWGYGAWTAFEMIDRPAGTSARGWLVAGAVLLIPSIAMIGWTFLVLGGAMAWAAPWTD